MKSYKKVLGLVLALVVSTAIFSACGKPVGDMEELEKKADDNIEIGLCFDSFVIERWQTDRDVFIATAQAHGATVNVQNANGDLEKQRSQIQYFIDKGVDALVIIPVDCGGLSDLVAQAKEKGIKIVSYDRMLSDAEVDLYISFDNKKVGQLMGEAIASQEDVQRVILLGGPLSDNNVPMINSAFSDVMKAEGIEIVDTFYAEGWKSELAGQYIYDNLELVSSVDAIMCGNDDLATQVIKSLSVRKLAGTIKVVGQDADLTACQHVVEGTQVMTVYKPVEKLAGKAAEETVKLIKGEDLETDSTINNGSYDIAYYAIDPIAVYADNMDEVIIGGGFHAKEEVYLNL